MKLKAIIFFLIASSFAYGQEIYPYTKDYKSLVLREYNYIYTSKNINSFYEKVKTLIYLNNLDSSYKATKVMWGLYLFDSTYSVDFFAPELEKIQKFNKEHFKTQLIGEWRFMHDFWTGMVSQITTTTALDTGNVVRFDGEVATFYFNDTLIRKTLYKIEITEYGNEFIRVNSYKIHFTDKNEFWYFKLIPREYGEKMILYVYDPKCSCGCRNDIYKKIEILRNL